MGCDIHFYVEKRDAETGNWTLVNELCTLFGYKEPELETDPAEMAAA